MWLNTRFPVKCRIQIKKYLRKEQVLLKLHLKWSIFDYSVSKILRKKRNILMSFTELTNRRNTDCSHAPQRRSAKKHLKNVNTLWGLQKAKLLCRATLVTDRLRLSLKNTQSSPTWCLPTSPRHHACPQWPQGERHRAGVKERDGQGHGDGVETRTER